MQQMCVSERYSRVLRNERCVDALKETNMRSMARGVADGGSGGGGPDPHTFDNRVGRPPRFENEVAKIRCFSDF